MTGHELLELAPVTGAISFSGSVLTGMIRRAVAGIDDPIGLNLVVCVVLALLLGAILPHAFDGLPTDFTAWAGVGGTAAASGAWTHNRFVKDKEPEP